MLFAKNVADSSVDILSIVDPCESEPEKEDEVFSQWFPGLECDDDHFSTTDAPISYPNAPVHVLDALSCDPEAPISDPKATIFGPEAPVCDLDTPICDPDANSIFNDPEADLDGNSIFNVPELDAHETGSHWHLIGSRSSEVSFLEGLPLEGSEHSATRDQEAEITEKDLELLRCGFRQLDKKEVAEVKKGGQRKSLYMERWGRNRFEDSRIVTGCLCMDSIEDMFENRLPELVDLLHDFFLQVQRKDGKPYPGETLVTLLRAIGRIICARLEERSIESSKKVEEFYILNDLRFKKCCVACLITVRRSVQTGIGRK